MKKYAFWSAILLMLLGTISIVIGAYYNVNHRESAAAYFKGGIIMELAGALWFFLSQRRINQKA
jgi:uncharacterized membrane protein